MSYGPGDNRIIIAADGDSIKSGFVKTKAQFDALYDRLASDLSPATSTKAGIVRIASQMETDTGSADAPVITPLKLASSVFAAKAAESTASLAASASQADVLRGLITKLQSDAAAAMSAALAAMAASGANGGSNVMEIPSAATFLALPDAAQKPYTPAGASYSRNRYEIRLPLMGRWIYCGALVYYWGTTSPEGSGEVVVPLCGVADGGTVIWGAEGETHGFDITAVISYGFIWRTATRENYEPGDTSVSGGVFGDSTSDTVSGGSL